MSGTRYEIEGNDMWPREHGGWVTFQAHQSLEAELSALKKAVTDEVEVLRARACELDAMQREWEAKPGGRDMGRLNNLYAHRCNAIAGFIRDEAADRLEQALLAPEVGS